MLDPATNAEALTRLATADLAVALAVAADPTTPAAAIECLVWRRDPKILAALAAREDPPVAELATLALQQPELVAPLLQPCSYACPGSARNCLRPASRRCSPRAYCRRRSMGAS